MIPLKSKCSRCWWIFHIKVFKSQSLTRLEHGSNIFQIICNFLNTTWHAYDPLLVQAQALKVVQTLVGKNHVLCFQSCRCVVWICLWHFRSFFVDCANLLNRKMLSFRFNVACCSQLCLTQFPASPTSWSSFLLRRFSYNLFDILNDSCLSTTNFWLTYEFVMRREIMFQVRPINLPRLALKPLSPLF